MGLRRVVVVAGVVALLVAVAPEATAATPTIVRAVGHCTVDGIVVGEAGDCPIQSHKITGTATATGNADVAARRFAVSAVAHPNRRIPLGRSASSVLEMHSAPMTGHSGRVKVVLSNLSGGSARTCNLVCAALGRTDAETWVWVQLYQPGNSQGGQIVCPVTWTGDVAPPTLVIPDDCSPTGTLEAPPNSTFEVVIMVIAQAQAAGGAAKARSTLSGVVSEIHVF